MSAHLIIEVRFLDGRFHGRDGGGAGDWPPAPARLFQALVAAAATGRTIPKEHAEALLRLEALDPPVIIAPNGRTKAGPTFYVPGNDLDAVDGDPDRVAKIRVQKTTSVTLFDPALPLQYIFEGEPHDALQAVVERLYRLGTGHDHAFATLIRADPPEVERRLLENAANVFHPAKGSTVPVATKGTFFSLTARHEAFTGRFSTVRRGRQTLTRMTNPPKPALSHVAYERRAHEIHIAFSHHDTFVAVPLEAAGVLVDGIRKGMAEKLQAHGLPGERFVVGRGATGEDLSRRIVIVPLPSIGHPEADPAIRRLLIKVPPDAPIDPRDISWALTHALDGEATEACVVIAQKHLEGAKLSPGDGAMARHYRGPARRWRTITPAALPAHRRRLRPGDVKAGDERAHEDAGAAAAVRRALSHARVRANAVAVTVQREPFQKRQVRAERFAQNTRFSPHTLWHVDLTLDRAVTGPLLIGDGRFNGLGLLRPVADAGGAFALCLAHPVRGDEEAFAKSVRAAIMGKVRDTLSSDELPAYFTGHAADGAPLRGGGRAHIAVLPDWPRQRVVILSPDRLARRASTDEERAHTKLLRRSLFAMSEVKAGRLGRHKVRAADLYDDDPLVASASRWTSVSPYQMTRHPRREPAADALPADVVAECARRQLPPPKVEIVSERADLRFMLHLTFPHPVTGPIVLGRSSARAGIFAPE